MRLSKEEFCSEYGFSEDEFFGRVFREGSLPLDFIEYLPEGISLKSVRSIYLESLKELPEGCSLKAIFLNLDSLKILPEDYLVDAERVICNIILPTFKGSSEFYFGSDLYYPKKSFKDYLHIKENPLKFLRSDSDLEKALAEYFLKNPQENL